MLVTTKQGEKVFPRSSKENDIGETLIQPTFKADLTSNCNYKSLLRNHYKGVLFRVIKKYNSRNNKEYN
jgi:hypothetical protein